MKTKNKLSNLVYLDYAAITPMDPEVQKYMDEEGQKCFGNPSSIHSVGLMAAKSLANSRRKIADILDCREQEIFFTAGGTESVNMAILGRTRKFIFGKKKFKPHVITTVIEHHAVLDSCKELEKEGADITYLPVDATGLINMKDLIAAIRPQTVLVSIMYVNNEVGTILPIKEISKVLKKINKQRVIDGLPVILFHSDACQAAGLLDINVNSLGVDALTLNGGKIYGPRQFGILYLKDKTEIDPIIFGGGQEKGMRSGTENIAAAAGFALALEKVQKIKNKESARLTSLRNYFYRKLQKAIPDIQLNGPEINSESFLRLPNNLNISIPNTDGEVMVIYLDAAGIECSTGSACSTVLTQPSHVIKAISGSIDRAKSSLRFTLGKDTNKKDIDYTVGEIVRLSKEFRVSI
jgi:cysteine desulfurase